MPPLEEILKIQQKTLLQQFALAVFQKILFTEEKIFTIEKKMNQ